MGVSIKYARAILKNKNMGQNLSKKYSKFQNFDEIYCGMTRFRNVKLDVSRWYQNITTILKKKNMGQNCCKKLSKFQKFQLSNFNLIWSNKGIMNGIPPDMTCSRELQQKNGNIGQTYQKNIPIKQFQ